MRYGRKYRKKRGCYRPGNRKDQILWWHPDGMTLKGDFDPMGGAKRSEGYQGVMSRGRMLRERDDFMLQLGNPNPNPPPVVAVEEEEIWVSPNAWMEEYRPKWDYELDYWNEEDWDHWLEERKWEQIEKGQEMADRLYPDYIARYYDEYEDRWSNRCEEAWPEYANHYHFDDYEMDEEERIEWTEWYKEIAA